MEAAVLLVQCPDKKGIVAKISEFLFENGANIIQSDQHTTDPQGGVFFMRVEFCFEGQAIDCEDFQEKCGKLCTQIEAQCQIFYSDHVQNMGIFVSKQDHCLYELLYRWKSGDLRVNIPFVISNHAQVGDLVNHFGIDFYHIPINRENKHTQEKKILEIVSGKTDLLVLARYMQILSADFLSSYDGDVINIHHSFLPSFKGANPYRQAYERGVKLIGATAHFVTEELDEGPIIEQLVERVSHRDNEEAMRIKGKSLEKHALFNAVADYLEHRIIRYRNRTVVFS
ncbi:Formyltetrahydrofolate deformylase [Chitinispirillum alkaliphilum]|nr:Formyltetrahydrofolate deformylase [Chitinispirillum alkaliphilum]